MPMKSSIAAKAKDVPTNAQPAPLDKSTPKPASAPRFERQEIAPKKEEAPKGFFARLWALFFGG